MHSEEQRVVGVVCYLLKVEKISFTLLMPFLCYFIIDNKYVSLCRLIEEKSSQAD